MRFSLDTFGDSGSGQRKQNKCFFLVHDTLPPHGTCVCQFEVSQKQADLDLLCFQKQGMYIWIQQGKC